MIKPFINSNIPDYYLLEASNAYVLIHCKGSKVIKTSV